MFCELQIDPASVMFKDDNKDLDLLQYLEAIEQEIIFTFSGPVPQKAFFPADHHYERDVSKTTDSQVKNIRRQNQQSSQQPYQQVQQPVREPSSFGWQFNYDSF